MGFTTQIISAVILSVVALLEFSACAEHLIELEDTANRDDSCKVCELIVGFLLGELGKDRNPDKIRTVMQVTCDAVPVILKKTCRDFMSKYAEPLIEAIQQGKTISNICQELSFCPEEQFTRREMSSAAKSISCEMCDSLVRHFYGISIDGKSEEQLINEMLLMCDTFSLSVASICRDLITSNGYSIVKYLKSQTPSHVVCQKLHLCRHFTISQPVRPLNQVMKEIGTVDRCVLCEWVVGTTELYLENTTTQKEIQEFLSRECNRLPKDYSYLCQELVERYLSVIMEYLLNQMSPQKTCSTLKLCSNDSVIS
jgi:hypothetical protein